MQIWEERRLGQERKNTAICINARNLRKNRASPAFGALFALNMLVATEKGDTYTEAEVRQWMQEAGLCAVKRKETNFGTTLIIGRKYG